MLRSMVCSVVMKCVCLCMCMCACAHACVWCPVSFLSNIPNQQPYRYVVDVSDCMVVALIVNVTLVVVYIYVLCVPHYFRHHLLLIIWHTPPSPFLELLQMQHVYTQCQWKRMSVCYIWCVCIAGQNTLRLPLCLLPIHSATVNHSTHAWAV